MNVVSGRRGGRGEVGSKSLAGHGDLSAVLNRAGNYEWSNDPEHASCYQPVVSILVSFARTTARFPLCSAQLPVREARRLRSRPPPFVSFFFSFKLTLVLFPPRKGKRRTHESQGLGANLEYPCESNRFYYAGGDALVFRARLRNAKSFGFLSSSRTFESKEKIYTSKNELIGNRLFRFYIIHHLL